MRSSFVLIALLGSCLAGAAQSAPPATERPKDTSLKAQHATPTGKATPAPTAITREKLEARLAQLKQAHDQVLGQLNALEGAQQAVTQLLQELDPPPVKTK